MFKPLQKVKYAMASNSIGEYINLLKDKLGFSNTYLLKEMPGYVNSLHILNTKNIDLVKNFVQERCSDKIASRMLFNGFIYYLPHIIDMSDIKINFKCKDMVFVQILGFNYALRIFVFETLINRDMFLYADKLSETNINMYIYKDIIEKFNIKINNISDLTIFDKDASHYENIFKFFLYKELCSLVVVTNEKQNSLTLRGGEVFSVNNFFEFIYTNEEFKEDIKNFDEVEQYCIKFEYLLLAITLANLENSGFDDYQYYLDNILSNTFDKSISANISKRVMNILELVKENLENIDSLYFKINPSAL